MIWLAFCVEMLIAYVALLSMRSLLGYQNTATSGSPENVVTVPFSMTPRVPRLRRTRFQGMSSYLTWSVNDCPFARETPVIDH